MNRRSAVGARELKTRLGAYLRRVRQGATLVVTERGEPVAELRPVEAKGGEEESALEGLRALGELTRQSREPLRPFKPLRIKGAPLSRTVIEDREDRF
jgi:prevent-host-death family protein